MNLVLPVPDNVAERLGEAGDVARSALEAFGIAEYQAERLTERSLCRMLGFDTRHELDSFLKEHGVLLAYTMEDVRHDLGDLKTFGGTYPVPAGTVVADTGPLRYLILIGQIDILPRLFGGVAVQATVTSELRCPGTPATVRAWIASPPP